jgi:cell division protein FtsL
MSNIKITYIFLWVTLTVVVALWNSIIKNDVQDLERQLASIQNNIQKDIDEIHVLKAEWSMYNTPNRLQKLAQEQLSLKKAKPEQIINYSALQFDYEDLNSRNKISISNKKKLTTVVNAEVKKR